MDLGLPKTRKLEGDPNKDQCLNVRISLAIFVTAERIVYEGWNFNSGNYLFTTDTK